MKISKIFFCMLACISTFFNAISQNPPSNFTAVRDRINFNDGWKFLQYGKNDSDQLKYDERPEITNRNDDVVADTKPTEALEGNASSSVLKYWILPTANTFIKDKTKHFKRPLGNPGSDFPLVQNSFDDKGWEPVTLPHDWAIKGPFYVGKNPEVGGGMGRLPIQGISWYRKKFEITDADKDKNIYLDIDGAMSYAMVWCNGTLVGGWPYGYNSFRLDLTPYLMPGKENQLAIRIDNPNHAARWYPGAGLYRNVWLVKTNKVQVAHWGTFVRTPQVSASKATVELDVVAANNSATDQQVEIITAIYLLDSNFKPGSKSIINLSHTSMNLKAGESKKITQQGNLNKPKLWGPLPTQKPNLYVAVTQLLVNGKITDEYKTEFGIRSLKFDGIKGLMVNDQPIRIQGVNQHHDLGALGAAFNYRAAERQLEILQELGCNAIRISHNPPAPELLELTDRMGFLVINEIFDSWERKKTPHDFHLIFKDWYEADTRSFVRRDRNHPSIIAWSYGNEVGEQYTDSAGAAIAKKLHDIVKEEDDTRPTTASMNYAKPNMPFAAVMDLISLNYQGEGIRDAPAYAHLTGIRTSPLYPAFHQKFPAKMIVSSETASALSTRGTYVFPVTNENSAPVSDSTGGDPENEQVSAYELYTAQFGASPDKVFASQDKHPFVSGEFVWSGWDYLGEPTPYYSARSSYCGIIDLAGFKKDRFYLYQSRWRPNLPMVHILPHWNWPNRVGEVTPVHIFTSGDEVELFLNGRSQGKKKKAAYEYRLRWDEVKYQPGQLKAVAYKNGKLWAETMIETTGNGYALSATADRSQLNDNEDLSFITIKVLDAKGNVVPNATNVIEFEIDGPGEIVATDNGDPADMEAFIAAKRAAYSGLAMVIVRFKKDATGKFTIKAKSQGLQYAAVELIRK